MAFPTVKSNNYKLLIFLILITLSSSNITQKVYFKNTKKNVSNNNSNITSNETDTSSFTEDPGSYLLGWFVIFFFMGLYIVCSMKNFKDIENRTDDVWKFMFFANNGILVAAGVNIFNIKNLIIDSSPFALSSIVFMIGCFYYICKFCRICNFKIAYQYFRWEHSGELCKLPCFIWSLLGLTDPCCQMDSYTVYTYPDGRTESDYYCVLIWNWTIYILKRFAVIITIMSYYIFLLFYLFVWLIGKLIFILTVERKLNPPSPKQEVNNNNNNDNNNGSKEIIINNSPPIFIINNKNNIAVNKTQNSYINKDFNGQTVDYNNPGYDNKKHFQNSGPERMKSDDNLFNNRENNETKKSDDNSKNNDDTNKKDDLPSEGEIYEKTPNDNSQNNEIKSNEQNGYIKNEGSDNIDKNNSSNDTKNNNMKDAPAPE